MTRFSPPRRRRRRIKESGFGSRREVAGIKTISSPNISAGNSSYEVRWHEQVFRGIEAAV